MTTILPAQKGLLPTPTMPEDLPSIDLTENSRQVLLRRYVRHGDDGAPVETVEEMFWRVAYHVAKVEEAWDGNVMTMARQYYNLLTSKSFFPNSPTFTGAGTPLGQLAACFVLPISDDMGRKSTGIFQTLRDAALIQQTGGGNGFSFSHLRPKGSMVKSSAGEATGPVGFLRVYDHAFGEVAQGGTRRGANMAVLRVDHPDVEDFVTCKTNENQITNFNISVGITDAFMRAVETDADWDLVFPDVRHPDYRNFEGSFEQARAAGMPMKVYKTVKARDLFTKIVKQAHHNGEPGVLFLDAANRSNPVPHLYQLEATNPCVPGDTLVATPIGWRAVSSINEGDEICTVLGTSRVSTIEVNDNVPVYKIKFSDGGSIRATAAHQFHARDSRTKFFEPRSVNELRKGDWVRVFRSTLPNNPIKSGSVDLPNRDFGFLVGVLVGDGSYTSNILSKNVVRISSRDDEKEWNAILENTFTKIGIERTTIYVTEGTHSLMMDPKPGHVIADWVKSLPLEPARGIEKTLPTEFINSNPEFLSGLLDGLFSTDGSVDLQSNHPLLRFHTGSRKLAEQVRLILLMFGVHGRISTSIRKRHDIHGRTIRNDHPKYDVTISGQNLGRFIEQIQLTHPEKRIRLEEAALRSNFTGGNWAAQVVSIEPDGNETVYDLYEPRSDTWITQGYVSRGCGEQWLGPYENCCLGSVNLAQALGPNGTVNWEKIRQDVALSARFLDDVVDANQYVPAVPALSEAAHRARRIGLGIMGLGDLMYHAGIRYGSPAGQEFAAQVMEFVRFHAMRTSIDLSEQRGPFPAIKGSIYDSADLKWQPPHPITPFSQDFGRPDVDWDVLLADLKRVGIRNAAQTTIAPTGTIATVAGCEGYGCEPVFALAYVRHVNDKGKDLQLTYASPLFEDALIHAGMDPEMRQEVVEQVMENGTCQNILSVPERIRQVFAVSQDITADEHVQMQAAMQAFVDNSLSKTINFPEGTTEEEIATAYLLAWKLGCKGITVYVTGSREKVVLETKSTASAKLPKPAAAAPVALAVTPEETAATQLAMWRDTKKPRPRFLSGYTYSIETPLGKAFVTINENGGAQPFEVFINTAKAGSETAAVSEALGRMISYILRLASPVQPSERLQDVFRQLAGIGGGRQLGFGPKRVRSLPDGLAQVVEEYLSQRVVRLSHPVETPHLDSGNGEHHFDMPLNETPIPDQPLLRIGDLCPECGQAAVVNEEGCRKCYACGYSEC